jgi:peptidoglycan hydrolase CwlO-like protein
MNRKQITFWLFLFLLFPTVTFAQQATRADIQVLEAKITNLETIVREMDKRLTNLETIVREMDKRLTNQIEEMDKRLSAQINVLFWAIGALVAVVLAVIALPQLLGYFQEKRARVDFQKEIDGLKQRLEQQQQEIESLKSRRLVTPS